MSIYFPRSIIPLRVIMLIFFASLFSVTWVFYGYTNFDLIFINNFIFEYPLLSIILFIFSYSFFIIISLPSLPLNLAAGFFWGGLFGGIYTTIGVTIGSWLSFFICRKVIGQPFKCHFKNKWLSIVQKEFDESGWKFVAFSRINPIIPTGPLNYFLALTSVSTKEFVIPSFVFLLPPSILVAYIGDTFQTVTARTSDVRELLFKIMCLSASISILFLFKIAINIYKKTTVNL